jgi:hypothetical protein
VELTERRAPLARSLRVPGAPAGSGVTVKSKQATPLQLAGAGSEASDPALRSRSGIFTFDPASTSQRRFLTMSTLLQVFRAG